MMVRVELFGIPRRRAGVEAIDIEADDLGGVLQELAQRLPVLCDVCLEGDRLKAGYLVNINGETFTKIAVAGMEND